MADVNFYLRNNNTEKITAVMMFFSYNGIRFKVGTVESIIPKFWNSKEQKAKSTKLFAEHPEFNVRLDNYKSSAKNCYRKYLNDNNHLEPSKDLLKTLIRESFNKKPGDKKQNFNLLTFTELFITDSISGKRTYKDKIIKPNTFKVYNTFLKNLIEFKSASGHSLSFERINNSFVTDLKYWFTHTKDYKKSTLGKHLRILRAVIKATASYDLEIPIKFIDIDFAIAKDDMAEQIYLNIKELNLIYNLDLKNNPRLDKARDLFILGCNIGQRFSDYSSIKKENIKDGKIKIITQKTETPVIIPINNIVKEIMFKYSDLTENSLPPTISNQKFNQYIKEVAELAGINEPIQQSFVKGGEKVSRTVEKFKLVCSHSARRSFITNQKALGIDSDSIRAVTGHSSESASFKLYDKTTPNERADFLAKKWKEKGI